MFASCAHTLLHGPKVLVLVTVAAVSATAGADPSYGVGQGRPEPPAPALSPRGPATRAIAAAILEAPGWNGRRSALAFNLGLGSAIGEMGATLALWPLPFLGTEAGLGRGFTGTQYSLMQKLALGPSSSAMRFLAGAGVAYAAGSSWNPGGLVWLNLDLAGFEVRTNRGFVFYLVAGINAGLAGGWLKTHPGSDCSPRPECTMSRLPGSIYPQARMGIGRWF